jgi:hypothetical protein
MKVAERNAKWYNLEKGAVARKRCSDKREVGLLVQTLDDVMVLFTNFLSLDLQCGTYKSRGNQSVNLSIVEVKSSYPTPRWPSRSPLAR